MATFYTHVEFRPEGQALLLISFLLCTSGFRLRGEGNAGVRERATGEPQFPVFILL